MNIDKLKLQTDIYNELISLGWTETDYNGFSDFKDVEFDGKDIIKVPTPIFETMNGQIIQCVIRKTGLRNNKYHSNFSDELIYELKKYILCYSIKYIYKIFDVRHILYGLGSPYSDVVIYGK